MKPQRRPFQFGIRKLMIWTTVWAVYLSFVQSVHWSSAPLVWHIYLPAVLAIRMRWGFDPGFKFAALLGGVLWGSLAFWGAARASGVTWIAVVGGVAYFLVGQLTGLVSFVIMHAVVAFVDWIDRRMETKSPPDP